jgi:uncharacterized protein (TIGR00730 family)
MEATNKFKEGPIIPAKEHVFLEGPKSRGYELGFAWRVFWQFLKGFRSLHFMGPCITVFGSARFKEDHVYYQQAREIGKKIAEAGFVTMTGGGPGIMEAANRGAHDVGAPSIGYNITLPMEQEPNAFSTPDLTLRFHYFAMRKMHFAMRANALVVFPGGVGTFDELFEILALRQTGKSPPIPIVLYDQKFWEEVINFHALVKHGVISKVDETLFTYAETPEQAWEQCVAGGVMTRWLQEQHTT